MNVIQSPRRKTQPWDVIKVLGVAHWILVTGAGLLITYQVISRFGGQIRVEFAALVLLAEYVIFDLFRLRFLGLSTISLGLSIILFSLLIDYPNAPFATLLIATFGSFVSEMLHCRVFSKRRLSWPGTFRRALFYTGHHAIAGAGALITYVFACWYVPRWLVEMIHIPATLVYVVTYSLVSMLLVRPHDIIRLLLAPDGGAFVRADLRMALLTLTFPVFTFYLCLRFGQGERTVVTAGVLTILLLMVFWALHGFVNTVEDYERLTLRNKVNQHVGSSTANIVKTARQLLEIMGEEVSYRWGAVYGLYNGKLELKGCGIRSREGSIAFLGPTGSEAAEVTGEATRAIHGEAIGFQEISEATGTTVKRETIWPPEAKSGEGVFGRLAQEYFPPQYFHKGLTPTTSPDLYLPRKTALMALPIPAESPGEKEEYQPSGGWIVLAQSGRLFTVRDWEKGQILSNATSNWFWKIQRAEERARRLIQNVEKYIANPEILQLGMQELIIQNIDVSRILMALRDRSLREDLPTILQSLAEGKTSDRTPVATQMLPRIYDRVREEAAVPVVPPLTERVRELLEMITYSLPVAFSLEYLPAGGMVGPDFKGFYEFLLKALNAKTIARITALDAQIAPTLDAVRGAMEAVEVLRKLRDIVALLKDYSLEGNPIAQIASLSRAMDVLARHDETAREKFQGSMGIIFLEITAVWRGAITDALRSLERGPARLEVSLRSRQAIQLEKITAGIVLQNRGPGISSGIMAQLEPSQDYDVLEGQVNVGTLIAGKEAVPVFTLRPRGDGPVRLQFHIAYNDPERDGKVAEFADLLYISEAPPPYTEIPNPYTPGPPLEPGNPTFMGREDIFEFIEQNIAGTADKKVLALVGGRRTGKTSILKHLPARLIDKRYLPIFVDCQGIGIDPGVGNFFLSLATDIAVGLNKFGIHVPHLTLSELGESPQHVFQRRFLPMVRDEIGERIVLLALDEFGHLGRLVRERNLPPDVFPYLRHLIQHEERLAFIIAGTHELEKEIGDYWSVLFNIAVYKRVGRLARDETIRLIREPVQCYGMRYDDLAVDEMVRLTACHAYFTQLLCHILVNRCNKGQRNFVTIQDVHNAEEELLEAGQAHLEFIWMVSGPVARLTLAALADLRTRSGQVTGSEIVDELISRQIDLLPSQIIEVMDELVAQDIVCEIPGYRVSYDFTTQLYVHWLRRYKPLSKVVEVERHELAKK